MNNKITLFTIGCPKCKVLKLKLDKLNVPYNICEDIDEMKRLGVTSAPMLKVDENLLNFSDAVNWVNKEIQSSQQINKD